MAQTASGTRTKELRALPESELRARLETLRRDLWQTRMKAAAGSGQQPHQTRATRRQIARVLTLLNETRRKGSSGE
jgi:large subunit ribosomal protein L29